MGHDYRGGMQLFLETPDEMIDRIRGYRIQSRGGFVKQEEGAFARERLAQLGDPIAAALDAGFVRFRPVLMTALAMIIGMVPMALGLGEGGEQNAPLGRAVIGGLMFATVATLVFVPLLFSMVHGRERSGDQVAFSSGVSHV